jgi:hypothetical protein
MKRDAALIRQILLAMQNAKPSKFVGEADFPEIENPVLIEHARLLEEAGLITVNIKELKSPPHPPNTFSAVFFRLTWKGHDYLEELLRKGAP